MVNDTSTVAGALQECIDHLEDNLAAKGVTASYAPSTGMIGLIDEILNIQTGGSCYHIEFSEDSYVAVGGSATLEVMLQSNYAPLSGATVTVTGSDSSLYTGITNSQGLAEITVSNITGTVSFTASYSNVTDTCTVTGVSYLFYDACDSASGLTNYGTPRNSRNNNTYSATLTLTDNSYYTVTQNTNNANGHIPITPITGLEDIKITMETYTPSGGNTGIGLVVWNSTSSRLFMGIQDSGKLHRVSLINGSTIDTDITDLSAYNKWITQEYTINSTDNSFILKLYDDTNTLLYTYTDTLNLTIGSNTVYGIGRQWYTGDARIRNIKAESL